jgi:hypothetical protein
MAILTSFIQCAESIKDAENVLLVLTSLDFPVWTVLYRIAEHFDESIKGVPSAEVWTEVWIGTKK